MGYNFTTVLELHGKDDKVDTEGQQGLMMMENQSGNDSAKVATGLLYWKRLVIQRRDLGLFFVLWSFLLYWWPLCFWY